MNKDQRNKNNESYESISKTWYTLRCNKSAFTGDMLRRYETVITEIEKIKAYAKMFIVDASVDNED